MSRKRDHEVSGDTLDRFAAKEASEEEGRLVFRHLLAGCPACLRHLRRAGWHGGTRETRHARRNVVPLGPPSGSYDEAFAAAERMTMVALEREHFPVRDLLAELEGMSPEERGFKVRNLRRYAEGELVLALVQKSFELRYSDMAAMRHYAQLAVAAAEAATPETAGGRSLLADCRARAWTQLGTAHRAKSELDDAERCLNRALRYLEQGTGDAEPRAWILPRLAALRTAQRAFHEAIELEGEAAKLCRRLRDRTGEATALIGGAWARIAALDPRSAIAPLQRCLQILDPWHPSEQRLVRTASINLILCYIDVGFPEDAYKTVVLALPYFEDCPDTTLHLRWTWQWGKADRDRGQFFTAEVLLTRARDGFEREGLAEEVGELSLDLGMLYARQSRRADFLASVADAAAIFHALGAKREYLAAVGQLGAMAQQEEAAVTLLRQLVLQCRGGVPRTAASSD